MKLSYDPSHNIAYIQLGEGEPEVETVSLSEEVNLDLAPDGTLFGIELMNANEQLRLGPGATFVVVNEAAGVVSEIALA
jgi:uncharacterized protein YuzE